MRKTLIRKISAKKKQQIKEHKIREMESKPMRRDSIFPKGTIIHIQNDMGHSETFIND